MLPKLKGKRKARFVHSGVVPLLLGLLESHEDCRHDALNILYNLSTIIWKWSNMLSVASVSKLVHLFGDNKLRDKCITILNNLVGPEEGSAIISETKDCAPAMEKLLYIGTSIDKEQETNILLLLCTNSFGDRKLVFRERLIPSLVNIPVSGSPNGKDKS